MIRRLRFPSSSLFLVLLFLWTLSATAAGQVPGADKIESVTLANGMTIIVWPDHDIPNVALYNWVRVGSRNEVPGITGLAHFFEHMMFNGTSTHPPGAFDQALEANGARNSGGSASMTATSGSSWNRCRPPHSSHIPTAFQRSAGLPTSKAGRWMI